jgi:Na+-transporting methylmalonyl-CoA/oxaloacetate decarboxylase gamma subunit
MVLVIIGIVKLQDGASVGTVLMKVGMGIVLALWAILAIWTLLSFRSSQGYTAVGVPADGTKVGTIASYSEYS